VLIDATLVRLVLAPAAMTLLGKAGWWLPRGLASRQAHRDDVLAIPSEPELQLRPGGEVAAER
jgi:uncharacterized membrane protein YdfJ with MMPL/SSD domain